MIDFVRGAGRQNHNALQDGDDQLSVQTSLQEGVQLRLLYDALKFVKLDDSVTSASDLVVDILDLHPDEFVSYAEQSNEEAENRDHEPEKVVNEPRAAHVFVQVVIVHVAGLAVENEGAL